MYRCLIIIVTFLYSCSTGGDNEIIFVERKLVSHQDSLKVSRITTTKNDSVLIIDTIINKSAFNVFWFIDGTIKVRYKGTLISRKYYPYDDYLTKGKSHNSMYIKQKNKIKNLQNIVVDGCVILFSLTDFKGRANIFGIKQNNNALSFFSDSIPNLNPIVNESSYLLIDPKNRIILNASPQRNLENQKDEGWNIYIYHYTDSTFLRQSVEFISARKLRGKDDLFVVRNVIPFYEMIYKLINPRKTVTDGN